MLNHTDLVRVVLQRLYPVRLADLRCCAAPVNAFMQQRIAVSPNRVDLSYLRPDAPRISYQSFTLLFSRAARCSASSNSLCTVRLSAALSFVASACNAALNSWMAESNSSSPTYMRPRVTMILTLSGSSFPAAFASFSASGCLPICASKD